MTFRTVSRVHSHLGPKTGKPARIVPPASRRRYEMKQHLIFLPLIVMILEVKVKIIKVRIFRKTIIRKKR